MRKKIKRQRTAFLRGSVALLRGWVARCRAIRTAQYATFPAGGVMRGSNRANTPKMAASINCRPPPLSRVNRNYIFSWDMQQEQDAYRDTELDLNPVNAK